MIFSVLDVLLGIFLGVISVLDILLGVRSDVIGIFSVLDLFLGIFWCNFSLPQVTQYHH